MPTTFDEYQATAPAGTTASVSFASTNRVGTATDVGYVGEMFLWVAMFQGTVVPGFHLVADNGSPAAVTTRSIPSRPQPAGAISPKRCP